MSEEKSEEKEPAFPDDGRISFEEFKLYYETADKVTAQRQSTNRWNYSVCSALLVAIGLLVKLSSDKPSFLIFGVITVLTLCAIAAVFCLFWLRQIQDAKALNDKKFSVLNEMAPRIKFVDEDVAKSYEPFFREWHRVKKADQTTTLPTTGSRKRQGSGSRGKLVVLKASEAELFVPKAFIAIFIGIIILAVATVVAAFVSPEARSYLPFTPPSASASPSPK